MADEGNGQKRRGPPLGSQNGRTHGLRCLQNEIRKRVRKGRSLIDRRSKAGRNAVAVKQQIVQDMGGEANLSAAQLVLIEMIGRDVYFLDECDRRIFRMLYLLNAKMKSEGVQAKSPRAITVMYHYRAGIARNLALLGLERKPPPTKRWRRFSVSQPTAKKKSRTRSGHEQKSDIRGSNAAHERQGNYSQEGAPS